MQFQICHCKHWLTADCALLVLKLAGAFKLIWLITECKWNENKTKNETGTKKLN